MEKSIEKLQVEYYDVEYGCFPFRLKAGDKLYKDVMSCYWDPLPDLKHWLEALAIGVEQTSFTYDNEGQIIKFDAQRKWVNREIRHLFTISWEDKKRIEFQVLLDKKQMIDAFYTTLIKFFKSADYDPKHWEWHSLHSKLEKYLDMDYSQLLEYCVRLNKQELIELLKKIEANDIYWIEDGDFYSKEYKQKTFEERKENMKELLNENANPYGGTSLFDFRSEIIEKYLNKK